MNLVNTEGTPIHRVLALIDDEARRWGTHVTGCEVVGLVPQEALLDAAEHHLRLEDFRRDQVLEMRHEDPAGERGPAAGRLPRPGGGRRRRRRAAARWRPWPARWARRWRPWWPGSRSGRRNTRRSRPTMAEAQKQAGRAAGAPGGPDARGCPGVRRGAWRRSACRRPRRRRRRRGRRPIETATWAATRMPLETAEACRRGDALGGGHGRRRAT